jgi:hypothetical protein
MWTLDARIDRHTIERIHPHRFDRACDKPQRKRSRSSP